MYWLVFGTVLLLILLKWRHPYFLADARHACQVLYIGRRLSKYFTSKPFYSLVERFSDSVAKHPHKTFIRFQDESYSYAESDKRSNKIARSLLELTDLQEGDTVAVLLGNEPVFLWLWLALAKIGCPAALLNINVRSKSLLHAFSCCKARVLIAGAEMQDALDEVLPTLKEQEMSIFLLKDHVSSEDMTSLNDKIRLASDEPIPASRRVNVTSSSPAVYIYTSGTTGLQKAARINHRRLWGISCIPSVCGVKSDDVIYVNLPLYHSAAFGIGFAGAIERGATIVLKSRFSSSQFWNDCRTYNVTVIQYIGETMRYLCNTPKHCSDRVHNVRIAIGNGTRAEIWKMFISRFGNIDVKELYGSTEGNTSFLNYTGKIGAVGRVNIFNKRFYPQALIEFDPEQEEPRRNEAGFCIKAAKGATGLLVSRITQKNPFSGYAHNLKQTEKKKLYDVFEKGDVYFNSGDLFRIDRQNFVYFQDRVGDTFRWKGENVSTNEVADVLTVATSIKEANVYGVTVPGYEGRTGMAAVTLKEDQRFDAGEMLDHVTAHLPSYARPRFIRITDSLAVTITYKHLKYRLVEEGFDPAIVQEPLFVLDETLKSYRPLTPEIHARVLDGSFRL